MKKKGKKINGAMGGGEMKKMIINEVKKTFNHRKKRKKAINRATDSGEKYIIISIIRNTFSIEKKKIGIG